MTFCDCRLESTYWEDTVCSYDCEIFEQRGDVEQFFIFRIGVSAVGTNRFSENVSEIAPPFLFMKASKAVDSSATEIVGSTAIRRWLRVWTFIGQKLLHTEKHKCVATSP